MTEQRYFILMSLGLGGLCCVVLLYATGLSVSFKNIPLGPPISILTGILCGYAYRPGTNQILNRTILIVESLALLSLASATASISTYPLAAMSTGWWDSEFLAADAAIGISWPAYWAFTTGNPILYYALAFAYNTFFIMPSVIVIALISTGKIKGAYRFISAFVLALVITDICMLLFPARSAAANLLPAGHPLAPGSGLLHIPVIEGLRDGSIKIIELAEMHGLISLPSFHAATSLLFAWGGWPVRKLRVPILLAEGLMLASTPIIGGHYFIDVVAGLGVAAVAIGISYAVSRRPTYHDIGLSLQNAV
ncbi:phosphatase PAP2 family protein [Sphingobium sp. DN12]|uniref:phosphatase PAP2 family protein n=1 Tax=Sphingobium sp. DN12 TaxID=3378073 RepID=UPI003DA1F05F